MERKLGTRMRSNGNPFVRLTVYVRYGLSTKASNEETLMTNPGVQ